MGGAGSGAGGMLFYREGTKGTKARPRNHKKLLWVCGVAS
jgi:hypothetical protein